MCWASPASGAFIQTACSSAGSNPATRNVPSAVTVRANSTVSCAVRFRASRRGGGNSWAARASVSLLPIVGKASASPTATFPAMSRKDASDKGTGSRGGQAQNVGPPRAGHAGDRPDYDSRQNPDANPHAASHEAIVRNVAAGARAKPDHADERHAEQRGEIFRADASRNAPPRRHLGGEATGVVRDYDAGHGREECALDERGGKGDAFGARTKRLTHAPEKSSRHQQRPTLDVNRAHEGGEQHGGERVPLPAELPSAAQAMPGTKNAPIPSWAMAMPGGLPDLHQRQQAGRGQEDLNPPAGGSAGEGGAAIS